MSSLKGRLNRVARALNEQDRLRRQFVVSVHSGREVTDEELDALLEAGGYPPSSADDVLVILRRFYNPDGSECEDMPPRLMHVRDMQPR